MLTDEEPELLEPPAEPSSYDFIESRAKSDGCALVADASLSPPMLAVLLDGGRQALEVDKKHVRHVLKQGVGCRCKQDCGRSFLAPIQSQLGSTSRQSDDIYMLSDKEFHIEHRSARRTWKIDHSFTQSQLIACNCPFA